MQRTLVLIKPDAVGGDVWLDIIKIYEAHGLSVTRTRILSPMSRVDAFTLYQEHAGKIFYDELFNFMTQGTTIALLIVGLNAIALVRALNGATRPTEAAEGTIRHKYGSHIGGPANAVHGSANENDAEREIAIFFKNYGGLFTVDEHVIETELS